MLGKTGLEISFIDEMYNAIFFLKSENKQNIHKYKHFGSVCIFRSQGEIFFN